MVANQSLWIYFVDAGMVVKTVMLILLAVSLLSWTLIFQRGLYIKKVREAIERFEDKFWSGSDLSSLYNELNTKNDEQDGMAVIFKAGFKEFARLQQAEPKSDLTAMSVQRAMRIAAARETDKLETHLAILASIGSTSPYIGLFGTVWGIMTSFHALGSVQQATIAMVAPGISEALIATAMGLFAAIPAVLAYNRYSNTVERLINQYDTFQEEFSSILERQA